MLKQMEQSCQQHCEGERRAKGLRGVLQKEVPKTGR